jgi:hypothetical protein
LIKVFDELWSEARDAFNQSRTFEKARSLAYGAITCMGRRTLTGMLTASGKQFMDWSSSYRIFEKDRVNTEKLFDVALRHGLQCLPSDEIVVAHLDDTLLKKTGKKVAGTAWRRDPLGPPFHTNFIWAQRFVQISLAIPQDNGCCQSRSLPVDFFHCPSVKRPKPKADSQELKNFREQKRILKMSKQGALRIQHLRKKLNDMGKQNKGLLMSVDGSYTNATVLKSLPDGVTLIGRVRKDAKFYQPAEEHSKLGRPKIYGARIPTPEQIRQSPSVPWQEIRGWAAGKVHTFNIKVVPNLLWRAAGEKHNLTLVIIRPLGYRLTKNSKTIYRQPVYLIHTKSNQPLDKLLQAYLWRWEIEVNFREEKTLIGCGQSQVRTEKAVKNLPAFVTAMYAFTILAAHKAYSKRTQLILPRPKWYPAKTDQRLTGSEMLNLFRCQYWLEKPHLNFSGFVKKELYYQTLKKISNPFTAAVFYARK